MVLILQRLMEKSPERSAFTGVETAVTGPLALKLETALLTLYTTLMAFCLVVIASVAPISTRIFSFKRAILRELLQGKLLVLCFATIEATVKRQGARAVELFKHLLKLRYSIGRLTLFF